MPWQDSPKINNKFPLLVCTVYTVLLRLDFLCLYIYLPVSLPWVKYSSAHCLSHLNSVHTEGKILEKPLNKTMLKWNWCINDCALTLKISRR